MPRIYIVDDDKDLLEVIQPLLLRKGFDVSAFEAWEDAADSIKTLEPQLILLDVFLSGIDGLELCQKLKASSLTKHIPVLLFSAFPKIAESAVHDYGADDFIAKPFEVRELIAKIHDILSKKAEPA